VRSSRDDQPLGTSPGMTHFTRLRAGDTHFAHEVAREARHEVGHQAITEVAREAGQEVPGISVDGRSLLSRREA